MSERITARYRIWLFLEISECTILHSKDLKLNITGYLVPDGNSHEKGKNIAFSVLPDCCKHIAPAT